MLEFLSRWVLEAVAGTPWADGLSFLRIFQYRTFRSAGAAVTALVMSLWLGPLVIAWLKRLKFGQDYTDRAEEGGGMASRVLSKRGTPTMGGIAIIGSAFVGYVVSHFRAGVVYSDQALVMWLAFYPETIRYEDQKLRRLFPGDWDRWAAETRALWPRLTAYRGNGERVEWSLARSFLRNGEPLHILMGERWAAEHSPRRQHVFREPPL